MSEHSSRKRLGRGLAALIGDIGLPEEGTKHGGGYQPVTDAGFPVEAARAPEKAAPAAEKYLPIEKIIRNPHNPRGHFAEQDIADLAQSIGEHGVVQPVLVRPSSAYSGTYELIAGERRWRAAQMAGLTEIPVLLRDVDDRTALELAIIENVQRTDLNPVEEALGYKRLVEEHGYLQADLAQIIGKSRSHLTNIMRLLKLPQDVLGWLSAGALSIGHARPLIGLENASALARQIVEQGLSVRQAENLAARGAGLSKPAAERQEKDPNTVALEKTLAEKLGLQVAINFRKTGGDIRIQYKTLDQLDEVCRRLEQESAKAAYYSEE